MESADFTNTEWNEAAIKAKSTEVLAEKADAKVISVSVSDSTTKITLRYGYSEATARSIPRAMLRRSGPPTLSPQSSAPPRFPALT